jgi:photosynthetic reaction center cytochrome c subunit
MRFWGRSSRAIVWCSGLFFLGTAWAAPQQQAGGQVRLAGQQFKNVQVLKDFPASDIVQAMHVVESSLGVNCEYCHIQSDRSKDDLEPKKVARRMMAMVLDVNKNTFGGQQVVTCYTCHRGSTKPVNSIMLPIPNAMIEHPEPAPPAMPSADQIFDKYIQAVGGEQAIRKVTSRMITATRDIPTGPGGEIPTPAQIEIDQKAPNLAVTFSKTEKLSLSEGYDGAAAWTQNAVGAVTTLPNPDQERAKRGADFYEALDLRKQYTKTEVRGIEKVNGKDAYVVAGYPANDVPERLFFDKQTGLLLARKTAIPTILGDNPVEVYFDDYRNTGSGVKIPFTIHMIPGSPRSEMWTNSTMKIQKVQDNVSIDNGKFTRPASKPPAPPAQ